MARLASLLAAGNASADVVAFHPGGVLCLSRDDDRTWRICWMMVPDNIPI
jgi:hypothetical protein